MGKMEAQMPLVTQDVPFRVEMASRGGSGWILGKFLMERVVQPWHSWNPHSWRDLKPLWMWHLGMVGLSHP